MNRIALSLLAVSLVAGSALSQTPPEPTTTLRTNARLVVLDVMALDSHGQTVHGLQLQDFKLRENGNPQTLKSLEDHTGAAPAPIASPAFIPAVMPTGTYTNRPKAQNNVWNVIVFDMLNTAMSDESRTREQLKKLAKTLPPDVPVALVRLSASSATLLVPFSAGTAGIDKLLAGKALSPLSSPLRDPVDADENAQIEGAYIQMAAAAHTSVEHMNDTRRETEMDRLSMKVTLTLSGLDSLAAWLEHFPGHKNLFWLSEGFPLSAEPQSFRNADSPGLSQRYQRNFLTLQQETDKRLESARVAVFPVDVRGVIGAQREGIDSIDQKGSYGGPSGAARLNEDSNQYDARISEERAGMFEIADATGGVATMNRNDLSQALTEKFRQGQSYYTLSYTPDDNRWNGDYRKIKLVLEKRGVKLYYRRGYFAVDRKPDPLAADSATSKNNFSLAMRQGAPTVTGLVFTAQLDRTVAGHLGLKYVIDPKTLAFSQADNDRKAASVECAVAEYDSAGKLLGTSEIRIDGRLPSAQFAQLQTVGFAAHQDVPLADGAKWVVVGIRDHAAGSFGTLQIPLEPQ
jgi:VWFA-related protein